MRKRKPIRRYELPAPTLELRPAAADPDPFDAKDMHDSPAPLAVLRMILNRGWIILSVLAVVFVAVLIGTLMQTPIYSAKGMVEFEKEHSTTPTLQEMFEIENISTAFLETQYKILQSESLAERVIDELRLEEQEEFNDAADSSSADQPGPSPVLQAMPAGAPLAVRDPSTYEKVLKKFQNRLSINPVLKSRLVIIRFEAEDPQLAADAVNSLARNYIQQSLDGNQKATEWLSGQLSEVKVKLEKAEAELQKYARDKDLLFLETPDGKPENIANDRLRDLQDELTRAQAQRFQKEALFRLVEAGDFGSLPGVVENKLMQDLTVRLADLRREQAQLAATFSHQYPKVKQIQNQIEELEATLTAERARAARQITNDYRAARRQEGLLQKAFADQQARANQLAERAVQYKMLKREVDTQKQLYDTLLQRHRQAGVSAGLKAANIRIVDLARASEAPVRPNLSLNLALAVFVGLGLGLGVAFLREYFDSSLKSPLDVERNFHVPALGLIPSADAFNSPWANPYNLYGQAKVLADRARFFAGRVKLLTAGSTAEQAEQVEPIEPTPPPAPVWHRIDANGDGESVLAEAFRSLRTSFLLAAANATEAPQFRDPKTGRFVKRNGQGGDSLRSLLVTSSEPGEGKTTVASNLAIALTQLGRRVLLIDADMRRPSIHRAFTLADHYGLADCLAGSQDWRPGVQPTDVAGLDVLVCGTIPPNPAELISSRHMQDLLEEAVEGYDFVILDSPPLLDVADSRILSTLVEGTLMVVKGGATPRELIRRAGAEAQDAGGNVIGIVLNQLSPLSSDYYYYFRYYRNAYGKRAMAPRRTQEERVEVAD
jgi:capsular exopolysaccharide synthesis family protein